MWVDLYWMDVWLYFILLFSISYTQNYVRSSHQFFILSHTINWTTHQSNTHRMISSAELFLFLYFDDIMKYTSVVWVGKIEWMNVLVWANNWPSQKHIFCFCNSSIRAKSFLIKQICQRHIFVWLCFCFYIGCVCMRQRCHKIKLAS